VSSKGWEVHFGDTGGNAKGPNRYKLSGKGNSHGLLARTLSIPYAIVSDSQWITRKGKLKDQVDLIKIGYNKRGGREVHIKSPLVGHWIVRRTGPSKIKKKKNTSIKDSYVYKKKEIVASAIPFPTMTLVPQGSFLRGCATGDTSCWPIEKPTKKVSIKEFFIATTEVTFAQYDFYCDQVKSCVKPDDNGWGRGNRPVINVTEGEVFKYIKWLNNKTKKSFRLPSESEWEYAARSGSDAKYFWGNEPSAKHSNGAQKAAIEKLGIAWNKDWVEWPDDEYEYTAPVASFTPNKWGLYDMIGNVHEICVDRWYKNHTRAAIDGSPWARGTGRVLKGGAWDTNAFFSRISMRGILPPKVKTYAIGIRLAMSVK